MKLSDNTLDVLKNYASINTALMFRKGNLLRTVSKEKTILAEATIDEDIPTDFGIFELNQLLSILSLHKTAPEITIDGNDVIIKGFEDRSRITYRCCDVSNIKTPPDSNIKVPSEDAAFLLSEGDLAWITKSASVLGCPNIAVVGKDGFLSLCLLDGQNDSAHSDTLKVEVHTGPDCFFMFKMENWKMMPGTYKVTVSSKGVAHFENTARKLQYWIALEQKAK
jgi:hypothetical protein